MEREGEGVEKEGEGDREERGYKCNHFHYLLVSQKNLTCLEVILTLSGPYLSLIWAYLGLI